MPDTRPVENLIAEFAELVDTGDFTGLGELFADGVIIQGGDNRFSGREAVEKMFRDLVILYDDGTPRTHHVTTNLFIDVDESAGTATARSNVTVFQAVSDMPLQPIAAGRYRDRFERHDSRWHFAERRTDVHLIGDVSRHLRP
jgi:ketosteroid isomerase-like protein